MFKSISFILETRIMAINKLIEYLNMIIHVMKKHKNKEMLKRYKISKGNKTANKSTNKIIHGKENNSNSSK